MHNVFLFDIDGTLLSASGAGKGAMNQAMFDVLGVRGALDQLTLGGRIDRQIVHNVILEHTDASIQESQREQFFDRICSLYVEYLPDMLAKCDAIIHEGVEPTLHWLSSHGGFGLGLGTGNMEAGAWLKLAHCGLDSFFGFGGFGTDASSREAVLEIAFERARQVHPTLREKRSCLVIGDTHRDIEAARIAGLPVAAVATGHQSYEQLLAHSPDYCWRDMNEGLAWMQSNL